MSKKKLPPGVFICRVAKPIPITLSEYLEGRRILRIKPKKKSLNNE